MNLSLIVLSRNSQADLQELLPSLNFGTEVLVIDDYSTDHSVEIARKYQAKVISTKVGQDFARARNLGLSQVKSEWVLYIDSDERVTQAFIAEVKQAIRQDQYVGFYLKRNDYFIDRVLQYGENAHNKFIRLARKDRGKWHRSVHEVWQISGSVGELKQPLIHKLNSELGIFLSKINHYSSLEAKLRLRQGVWWSWWQTLVYPVGKFVHNYVVRRGFLDGFPGLIMAFFMSLHSLCVRIKLYED